MNYAYVTLLSTDSYYKGVVALFECLKKTNTKINNFVVVINETISSDIVNKLKDRGYKIYLRPRIDASNIISNKGFQYWINTFDKFYVFELTDYDKIVYLDSDMYITRNIDELFDYPHMTAVIAGKDMYKQWVEIGSGMMVIVPEENMVEKFMKTLKETKFTKDVGDQDVIEAYFNWKDKNLAISENYNLFANYIDYYINELNYRVDQIGVIHFIGSKKPWMYSEEEVLKHEEKLIYSNKKYELKYFREYREELDKVI